MNETQMNQTPEVAAPVVELSDVEMKESPSIEVKSEVVEVSKEPEKITIQNSPTPVIISFAKTNQQTSKPDSSEKSAITGAYFTLK